MSRALSLDVTRGETVETVGGRLRDALGLGHPGIATLVTAGCEGDELRLEWEKRAGEESLSKVLGELEWPDFQDVLQQLLEALSHGHARGVVHGGVTPYRVGVSSKEESRGVVRIFDFGVHSSASLDGLPPEEECFRAPETWGSADRWTGATDLFSVGWIAHQWLYGRRPNEERGHRREQHHFVPGEFPRWIDSCLRRQAPRFPLAVDALEALEMVIAGESLEGFRGSPVRADWREGELEGGAFVRQWWREPKLYGMREFAMVGRTQERWRLWRALLETRRRRRPRVVLISGPGGVGKSRMARWLCHRAQETGTGGALEVSGGTGELNQLGAYLASQRRPWVVWIDDADRASGLLDWVEGMIGTGKELPVLFVISVTDELLVKRPVEAVQIAQLLEEPGGEELSLGPMERGEFIRLLRSLGPITEEGAIALERRLGGNPLFARQLMHHWLAKGVLSADEPRSQVPEGVPDDLVDFWEPRVGRLIAEVAADEEEMAGLVMSLKVAAVLGLEVSLEEWGAVCRELGVPMSELLIRSLMAHRLLEEAHDPGAVRFSHSMLRESLVGSMKKSGEAKRIHGACARVLATAGGSPERLGVHLLETGRCEEALEELMDGMVGLGNHGEHRHALALQVWYQRACDEMGLGPGDRRRVVGWIRQAWSAQALGLEEVAREALNGARARLKSEDEEELLGRIYWLDAGQAFSRGELGRVEESLRRARDHFETVGDQRGLAGTWIRVGSYYRERGELEEAEEAFSQARAYFDKAEDPAGLMAVIRGQASILGLQGRLDEAEALLLSCEEFIEGSPKWEADLLNNLGEVYRERGGWQEAEEAYRRAAEICEEMGDPTAEVSRINLGMTLVEQERYREALEVLERAEAALREVSFIREQMYAMASMLPCLAATQDWPRWSEYARVLEVYLTGNQVRSRDLRRMFEISLELARESAPEPVVAWARLLVETQEESGGDRR